jgi:DNA adenine methylase
VKGKGLYQNFFIHEEHCRLYQSVCNIQHLWIVTYDDTPEIYNIYANFEPEPFGLTYTAQTKRKGSEVIIHNPDLMRVQFKPDITFNELRRFKNLGKKARQ